MMKVKVYEYIIAYHHKNGTGTAYVRRNKKIESISDALELQNDIERKNGIENVGLVNVQLLREFKEAGGNG